MILKNENIGQFAMKRQFMINYSTKSSLVRPRALIYHTMLKFNDERFKQIKNKRRPIKIDKIYSGECDFPFRFKILGLENASELFRHYENECYYNGKQVPNFVAHHPWKKDVQQSTNRMGETFKKFGDEIKKTKVTKKVSDEGEGKEGE